MDFGRCDDIPQRHILDAARDANEQDDRRVKVLDGAFAFVRGAGVASADFGEEDLPSAPYAGDIAALIDGTAPVLVFSRIQ